MREAYKFGQRLKELREAAGLTQQALAEKAGVAQSAVAQWETGTREPGWSMVLALAAALDVECTAFVPPTGKKKGPRSSPRKGESEG